VLYQYSSTCSTKRSTSCGPQHIGCDNCISKELGPHATAKGTMQGKKLGSNLQQQQVNNRHTISILLIVKRAIDTISKIREVVAKIDFTVLT